MSTSRPPVPKRRSRRAVPSRFRAAPPAQARSRETMDRFAEATEELLRDRPFEEISIQEIARRADRPIGSFYARFGCKDALLPHLYRRYHEGLEALFASRLARFAWEELDFPATVGAIVDFLLGIYVERAWLIRTLALFARSRPEALPDDLVERRGRLYDGPAQLLLRHRAHIAHRNPEAAVRFGLFLVSSVTREKLLFS